MRLEKMALRRTDCVPAIGGPRAMRPGRRLGLPGRANDTHSIHPRLTPR